MSMMVILYLGVIVLANMLVLKGGPAALPYTAFFLIPFDLVTRDYLHQKWHGQKNFFFKMFGLILAGSVLSLLLNIGALNIALASCTAFLLAGSIDSLVFSVLYRKPYLVKVNVSNAFSALTDSLIFPWVAFGLLDPSLSLKQAIAKTLGGVLWAFAIKHFIKEKRHGHKV
jgi:uncharacterized PurR-regulated membrane protein YhhQ (DUF165 family)